jgi:type IV secretory pathway protease TraF
LEPGAIANPTQLLATPPLTLTMPLHRRVTARSSQEHVSIIERKVFIILEPTLDGLPTDDDGAPCPKVSMAAQELLKHPSKAW